MGILEFLESLGIGWKRKGNMIVTHCPVCNCSEVNARVDPEQNTLHCWDENKLYTFEEIYEALTNACYMEESLEPLGFGFEGAGEEAGGILSTVERDISNISKKKCIIRIKRGSKRKGVLGGKVMLYPIETDRQIFPAIIARKEKDGSVIEFRSLSIITETHRDILDAIAVTGKLWWYGDSTQLAYTFHISDVLKALGHERNTNQVWILNKLRELLHALLGVKVTVSPSRKVVFVTHLIDRIGCVVEKIGDAGNKKTYAMVLGKEFSYLFTHSYTLFASPSVIEALLKIKHEFVKFLVRYTLTHEWINIELTNLLQSLGIKVAEDTLAKYKKQLRAYKEYLDKYFGIKIENKRGKVIISYQKDARFVAMNYKPELILSNLQSLPETLLLDLPTHASTS